MGVNNVPRGPWWLDERYDGVGVSWTGGHAICAQDDTGTIDPPSFVAHTTRGWDDGGIGNARLIAAAPQLYAALRACLEAVNQTHDEIATLPDENWIWWDKAHEALRKAESGK